jgi:protein O-mannosyl-transferase
MNHEEGEVTLRGLFLPLTTKKAIIFIFLIGFIVFFNALFGRFTWDDVGFIQNNPEVHAINFATLFRGNNTFNTAGYYRPVSATYFAVIYSIFGNKPLFFHLIQITIHILNAILVFMLFKRFFREKLALFLAIIFLVHPINVESVSYIGASQSVVLSFLGLLAFLINLQSLPKLRKIFLVFVLLLLSLLAKETGILFVLMIFCYQWLVERKQSISYLILSVTTVIVYLSIRFIVGNVYLFKIPFIPMAQLSLGQRLINIPSIIIYYLKTIIFPLNLIIEQQWEIGFPTLVNFCLPFIIIIGLLCLLFLSGVKLYKTDKLKFRQLLFFSIWFMAGLGFLLQIFPLDMTVADRWFYVPLIGLLGVAGLFISGVTSFKKYSNIITTSALIIIILLSVRTIVRNNDWHDTLTLLKHDTQIQTNFDNENNLGMEYSQIGDIPNALIHFQKSVSLDPFELNLSNVGVAYLKLNQLQKAKYYLLQSLTAKRYSNLDHKHALSVYVNMGTYLTFYGDPSEAVNLLSPAVIDYPSSGELYYLLSVAEYMSDKKDKALFHIKKAYALDPAPETGYAYNQINNNLPLVIKKSN